MAIDLVLHWRFITLVPSFGVIRVALRGYILVSQTRVVDHGYRPSRAV